MNRLNCIGRRTVYAMAVLIVVALIWGFFR